jgi:hypothetical protein
VTGSGRAGRALCPGMSGPQDLIHTNKSPNPVGIGVSDRSHRFESKVREAVFVLRPVTRLGLRCRGRFGRSLLSFVAVTASGWAFVTTLTRGADGGAT